ncbi:hypothetical protein AMTR_s00062p00157240 [Amborella trichopoda]|uniref:Uncharacterized protein n=1 Tax=Amborella trichopoda TaxID=13333 RepID=U5DE03_AMBTC|nr:hypothetical protein AMTR_s00062p00157240 [Amborella trichopoda]
MVCFLISASLRGSRGTESAAYKWKNQKQFSNTMMEGPNTMMEGPKNQKLTSNGNMYESDMYEGEYHQMRSS